MLRHWRYYVLAGLLASPVLILVGFGMYYLWETGLAFWLWWPLSAFLVAAYVLGWRWQKKRLLLPGDLPIPLHWTDRDRAAWHLVEAKAAQAKDMQPEQFTDIPAYTTVAQELARELARFYHPRSADPVSSLTIPEMLAVVELAAHDLGRMVDEYLPGGHLLTISDFRRVKQVADWYPTVSKISWLISGIFSPLNTAVRYLASQAGMSWPWQLLQENVLIWFYTAYVHRLGSYLIELNSGRLRVGAKRYMELQKASGPPAPDETEPADAVRTVAFVLIGQTKAGKSSLVNALLGEQKAFTDVIPATAASTRYELHPAGIPTQLQLVDTVGYGNAGPKEDQVRATEEAARNADIIFLVLHARNPARQADVDMMNQLGAYYLRHPELRKPPVIAVLTHIDLLSPMMEWAPPYDWQMPERKKEHEIAQAVAAADEQLTGHADVVVPVCAAPDKVYGVDDWLMPAIAARLDQAHAVAFLRCLKGEASAGKIRKVFHQLLAASKGLGRAVFAPRPP